MNRFARQISIPFFGEQGQKKLSKSKILVVGAGGLGVPVLLYLNASGVEEIGIVEFDVIQESNLHRQIIYTEEDIGKPKIEVLSSFLKKQNSFTRITCFDKAIQATNALKICKKYDLIVDCSDNFATRYLINDACEILNKPFISGAIFRLEGQIGLFNWKNSSTYRDLYPSPPPLDLSPNCETAGVLGPVAGIVASFMATEAMKCLSGIHPSLSGKLLLINAENMAVRTITIPKDHKRAMITSLIDYEAFCNSESLVEITYDQYRSKPQAYPVLLDVRTEKEYNEFNLGGTNIPLNELETRWNEIPKVGDILVHCQSGVRSKKAIALLSKKFEQKMSNLKGGINAISRDVLESLAK